MAREATSAPTAADASCWPRAGTTIRGGRAGSPGRPSAPSRPWPRTCPRWPARAWRPRGSGCVRCRGTSGRWWARCPVSTASTWSSPTAASPSVPCGGASRRPRSSRARSIRGSGPIVPTASRSAPVTLDARDPGARDRLEAAFADEERRGLMLASATRSAAVVIIIAWLAAANPLRGWALAWVLGTAAFFLVTGLAQLGLYARRLAPPITPYVFMLVDSLALAAFFLLPMQAAFSFRPGLLLWTGLCGVGAWTLGFVWIVTRPATVVDGPGAPLNLGRYLDPNYVSVLKYENEVIAFLLVSAGLALLVRRSRALVMERVDAERTRGNLARYFSPKVVETLAERDEPLGRVRRQSVGVLFA